MVSCFHRNKTLIAPPKINKTVSIFSIVCLVLSFIAGVPFIYNINYNHFKCFVNNFILDSLGVLLCNIYWYNQFKYGEISLPGFAPYFLYIMVM